MTHLILQLVLNVLADYMKWRQNMKLTAILASAVLIEAQVSNLRSKMTINFTPGCLVLQKKKKEEIVHSCMVTLFNLW